MVNGVHKVDNLWAHFTLEELSILFIFPVKFFFEKVSSKLIHVICPISVLQIDDPLLELSKMLKLSHPSAIGNIHAKNHHNQSTHQGGVLDTHRPTGFITGIGTSKNERSEGREKGRNKGPGGA